MHRASIRGTIAAIAIYAIAMAYVESAVVVDLRAALGMATRDVFPTPPLATFGWIEVGREAATLFMIGGVAWIAGRSPLERLAWAAVVFGIWDLGYYFWLWVFSGWPTGLGTWDLLFLLPLPWAGPVWAPMVESVGLIGFGLAYAVRSSTGTVGRMTKARFGVVLLGGLVVIASFLTNTIVVLDGGTPTAFAWPVFVAGMAIGIVAAIGPLRAHVRSEAGG